MKLYRVHLTIYFGESDGYAWVTNRRAAKKIGRNHVKTHGLGAGFREPELVEAKLTAEGLLEFAHQYASYANNG